MASRDDAPGGGDGSEGTENDEEEDEEVRRKDDAPIRECPLDAPIRECPLKGESLFIELPFTETGLLCSK